MGCKGFWIRAVSFAAAFTVGLPAANFRWGFERKIEIRTLVAVTFQNNFRAGQIDKPFESQDNNTTKVKIIEKPTIAYCGQSKESRVRGRIRILVTFLANGEIGAVYTTAPWKSELNEKASMAAKDIIFKPATRNGKPVTVIESVEYNF
jgi:hypothetical protein